MALSPTKAILTAKTKPSNSPPSFRSFAEAFATVLDPKLPHNQRPTPLQPASLENRKPKATSRRLPNVKSRLEPLLPSPPISLATLELLHNKNLSKACPALFDKTIQTEEDWSTVLSRKVDSNLKKLKATSHRVFINERLKQLKKGGRCFNCQGKGHLSSKCTSTHKCLLCSQTGHSLKACTLLPENTQALNSNLTAAALVASNPPQEPPSFNDPPTTQPASTLLNTSQSEQPTLTPIEVQPPHLPLPQTLESPQAPLDANPMAHPNLNVEPPFDIPLDWENMNLVNADNLYEHRPALLSVYMPDDPELPHQSSLLLRSAVITFHRGWPFGDYVHHIRTRLAHDFGGPLHHYRLTPINPARSKYLLVCQSVRLRDTVCRQCYVHVGQNTVKFVPWTRGYDCATELQTFFTKVRIIGVPLGLWTARHLDILTSGFGTPIRVAPNLTTRNLVNLTLLVKGPHPVKIPRELMISHDPFAKFAQVIIDSYIQVWPYNDDPPYFGPGMPWNPPEEHQDDQPEPMVSESSDVSQGSLPSDGAGPSTGRVHSLGTTGALLRLQNGDLLSNGYPTTQLSSFPCTRGSRDLLLLCWRNGFRAQPLFSVWLQSIPFAPLPANLFSLTKCTFSLSGNVFSVSAFISPVPLLGHDLEPVQPLHPDPLPADPTQLELLNPTAPNPTLHPFSLDPLEPPGFEAPPVLALPLLYPLGAAPAYFQKTLGLTSLPSRRPN